MRLVPTAVIMVVSAGVMTACSNSSSGKGGGSMCDAAECASLEAQIVAGGGGPATCNEPPPAFETACQTYETCLKQCGQ